MNKAGERLYNGLVKENPTFVLMLGMCPTLAVTTSAMNGLGMGLTTMVVLALSNLFISLLRKVIPNRVRIPAFIVVIASFVTVVQLLLEAYLPALNKSLGVYIPLIVVNCIILGRAESYAYSNPPIPSLFDGIGMGLGFSFALTCIGAFRELLGAGKLFGAALMPEGFEPIRIFGQAPGAFFVLAMLVAAQNYIKNRRKKAGKPYEKIGSGCSEDCMNCSDQGCTRRFYDTSAEGKEAVKKNGKTASTNAAKVNTADRQSGSAAQERMTKPARKQSDDAASGKVTNSVWRQSDNASSEKTANSVRKQSDNASGEKAANSVRKQSDNATGGKVANSVRKRSDNASKEKVTKPAQKKSDDTSSEKTVNSAQKQSDNASSEKVLKPEQKQPDNAFKEKAAKPEQKQSDNVSKEKKTNFVQKQSDNKAREKTSEPVQKQPDNVVKEKIAEPEDITWEDEFEFIDLDKEEN